MTAVLPYFPYGRHAKKKSHRGCITARMLASLMHVAGVNHVITVDLHASQMQGFFKCPMDNLVAEPLLARWVRMHVRNWQEAVVVSKNPGGTKRATSLADALDLGFGVITTDHRRILTSASQSMSASLVLTRDQNPAPSSDRVSAESSDSQGNDSASAAAGVPGLAEHGHGPTSHPFSRARMRTFPTDGPDSSPPTTSSGVARVNSAPVIGDETSNKDYEDGDEVLLLP